MLAEKLLTPCCKLFVTKGSRLSAAINDGINTQVVANPQGDPSALGGRAVIEI